MAVPLDYWEDVEDRYLRERTLNWFNINEDDGGNGNGNGVNGGNGGNKGNKGGNKGNKGNGGNTNSGTESKSQRKRSKCRIM